MPGKSHVLSWLAGWVARKIVKAPLVGQVWPLSALTIFPAREASHKQNYDQEARHKQNCCPGGFPQAGRLATSRIAPLVLPRCSPGAPQVLPGSSPQISVWNPRGSPRGLSLGFQTEIHFKPRASPQEALRPGRLPTSRFTTREAPHRFLYVTQEEAPADHVGRPWV